MTVSSGSDHSRIWGSDLGEVVNTVRGRSMLTIRSAMHI